LGLNQEKDVVTMSDPSFSGNPDSDSHHCVHRVSFGRIQEDGPAALAPAPDLGIGAVFLVEAVHRWFNAYNLRTSRRADDLLAASARFPEISELFPKGAELLTLTLELIIENSPEPCRVVLEAPDKLLVQNRDFAERIEIFLARRGLVEILRPSGTVARQTTRV
jgi:hypothetical protein